MNIVQPAAGDEELIHQRCTPTIPSQIPPNLQRMMILAPNDPGRDRVVPRRAILDTGSAWSFTYESALNAASLPFYYHRAKKGLSGFAGNPQYPIGSSTLVWYEPGRDDNIFQTCFQVFEDRGFKRRTDFVIGRDWLVPARYELLVREEENNSRVAVSSSEDSTNTAIFFAVSAGTPNINFPPQPRAR